MRCPFHNTTIKEDPIDMTKTKFLGVLAGVIGLASLATQTKAQVSLNVNICTWNPPATYADASYYYLPDVNSYYYVPTHQYIYMDGGNWVWRRSLPTQYNYYNINNGYKVAMYRDRPYRYFETDRVRYARYRGVKNVIVRDRFYRPGRVVNNVTYIDRGPRGRGPKGWGPSGPGRGPKGWGPGHGPGGPGHGPGGPGHGGPGHGRGHH